MSREQSLLRRVRGAVGSSEAHLILGLRRTRAFVDLFTGWLFKSGPLVTLL